LLPFLECYLQGEGVDDVCQTAFGMDAVETERRLETWVTQVTH
jgi:hypothetical protein